MKVELREFSRTDWMAWAGCENFKGTQEIEVQVMGQDHTFKIDNPSEPLIGELKDDLDRPYLVIADGTCVSVYPCGMDDGRSWQYYPDTEGWSHESARLVVAALPAPWVCQGIWTTT